MGKPPLLRSWRSFYDRLIKSDDYRSSISPARCGPYHTYRDQFVRIDRLLKRYPRQIAAIPIGTSVGGEPIWVFRVSNTEETAEPRARFLVLSLLHAMEFVGAEVNLTLFQRFVANMNKNPALANREVHFLPILNPDGYLDVERGLSEGRTRFRRGNRRGVDLNRNFSAFFSKRYLWHRVLGRLYNPGPRPFSEPETAALRSHLLEHRFDFALSLHSFGGRLLYPYGGKREKTRFDSWYRETARALIDLQPHYGYKAGQLARAFPFFLVRGAEADYLHETFGTRTFVVEIARNGLRVMNPRHLIDPFPLFNPKELQREIDNLMDPFFFFLSLNRDGRV